MNSRIGFTFSTIVCIGAVVLFAGCRDDTAKVPDNQLAVDALLVSKAESVSAAISTLDSLDKGEVAVARSTLKAQVKSGLNVLRHMKSEQVGASTQFVDNAIAEAEAYLAKQGEKAN